MLSKQKHPKLGTYLIVINTLGFNSLNELSIFQNNLKELTLFSFLH